MARPLISSPQPKHTHYLCAELKHLTLTDFKQSTVLLESPKTWTSLDVQGSDELREQLKLAVLGYAMQANAHRTQNMNRITRLLSHCDQFGLLISKLREGEQTKC